MIPQKRVKFRDRLEEVAEGEETAINCPSRAGGSQRISIVTQEEDARWDRLGPRGRVYVKANDGRVRDAIQETEAKGDKNQRTNRNVGPEIRKMKRTARVQIRFLDARPRLGF